MDFASMMLCIPMATAYPASPPAAMANEEEVVSQQHTYDVPRWDGPAYRIGGVGEQIGNYPDYIPAGPPMTDRSKHPIQPAGCPAPIHAGYGLIKADCQQRFATPMQTAGDCNALWEAWANGECWPDGWNK